MTTMGKRASVIAAFALATSVAGCKLLDRGGTSDEGGTKSSPGGESSASGTVATTTMPSAAASPPSTVVAATEKAWGVASDGEYLYWSANATSLKGLRRQPRGGGAATTLCTVDDLILSPQTLLVDATHVYALAAGLGDGAVFRAAKGAKGGSCEKVASGIALVSRGIAKVGDKVYVIGSTKARGSNLLAIDAAGKSTVIGDLAPSAKHLVTDGTNLFYTTAGRGSPVLMKVAPSGGASTELGKGGGDLFFADGRLFFSEPELSTVPVAGASPGASTSLSRDIRFVASLAVVGTNVYATTHNGIQKEKNGLYKGSVNGGEFRMVSKLDGGTTGIVADAKDVFVATDGAILRFAP